MPDMLSISIATPLHKQTALTLPAFLSSSQWRHGILSLALVRNTPVRCQDMNKIVPPGSEETKKTSWKSFGRDTIASALDMFTPLVVNLRMNRVVPPESEDTKKRSRKFFDRDTIAKVARMLVSAVVNLYALIRGQASRLVGRTNYREWTSLIIKASKWLLIITIITKALEWLLSRCRIVVVEKEEIDQAHVDNSNLPTIAAVDCSPYYLGPSDNLRMSLVAVPLTGDNYCSWARLMKIALKAKIKLGFINGSIKKPAPTSSDFLEWEKVDAMVKAWIANSIHPDLHGSILYVSTARDVWLDLEERFAQTNNPRIHQLWRELCLMQQDTGMNVTDFYTKTKCLWDELGKLQPLAECTCGVAKEIARREEDQRVHMFLGGLDGDRFDRVKGTILNIDPLPSLERTFNIVLKEESRLAGEQSREARSTSAATFHAAAATALGEDAHEQDSRKKEIKEIQARSEDCSRKVN